MSGKHANDVRDAFFPALLVHAVVFPKILWDGFQEYEVVLAQYSERFQRGFGITLDVVESVCPGILIERLYRGAVLAQNHPHTPAAG